MVVLVRRGVSLDRLTAEDYRPMYPIADNSTSEVRIQK